MRGPSADVVSASGIPAAARTLAGAFSNDPLWGWVFNDPDHRVEQLTRLWTLFLDGAVGYGWVRATPSFEAVALWIPPNAPELPEPHADRLAPLVAELLGARAALAGEVFDRFDETHPHDAPHFYLSFLGTDPAQRGRGIGMQLLRATLAEIDAAHEPAYLESTNPANLARYESAGFRVAGEFDLPGGGPNITQMWRPAAA